MVVGEMRLSDIVRPLSPSERLNMMHRRAIRVLSPQEFHETCLHLSGEGVKDAEHILTRVPEPETIPPAGLVKRGRTRPIESRMALHLVPDISHTVESRIRRLHPETTEPLLPILRHFGKSGVDSARLAKMRAQLLPFRLGVAHTSDERNGLRLVGRKLDLVMECATRCSANGDAVLATTI